MREAEAAYEAYRESIYGVPLTLGLGGPLPFAQLDPHIKAAWLAAAEAVLNYEAAVEDELAQVKPK